MKEERFLKWGEKSGYHEVALLDTNIHWQHIIKPFISDYFNDSMNEVIDLACGQGRFTDKLSNCHKKIYAIDVNHENVKYCQEKYKTKPNVVVFKCNGYTLPFIMDNSISGIFCFDAMVHFDIDVIMSYLKESCRVLAPGGVAFFHHANLDDAEFVDIEKRHQWRNFMTKNLFAFLAKKAGLHVIKQETLDWGGFKNLDCLTLLKRGEIKNV